MAGSAATVDAGGHRPLGRARLVVLGAAFAASGAAALVCQVAWQRTIALHAGVDLESSTVVVASFLAGLGIGNLLGGRLADRLDRRGALLALAAASAAVAAYAAVSPVLLYDLYRELAQVLRPLPARLAFNGLLLVIPTVVAGMGLPLVARAVTVDVAGAGSRVGAANALNTFGAAAGALTASWVLIGQVGFDGAVRVAALVQVGVAVLYLGLASPRREGAARREVVLRGLLVGALAGLAGAGAALLVADIRQVPTAWPMAAVVVGGVVALAARVAFVSPVGGDEGVARVEPPGMEPPGREPTPATVGRSQTAWSPSTWYLIYGTTGAIALAYEVVLLRVVAGVMRSNTYTFGHVLGLYLALLAAGGLLGSWARPRIGDHRRAFLWLQFAVGASAGLGVVAFVHVLPATPLGTRFDSWFATDGFANGFGAGASQMALFGLVVPLLLMALPVVAMGAAHPFAQGLVIDDLGHVGDRTGRLQFANVVGNVAGTLLASLVLLDRLGSAGTLRLLVSLLVVAGIVATALSSGRRRTIGASAVAAVALLVVAMPTNVELWSAMSHPEAAEVVLAEDRSCASSLERRTDGDDYVLAIDATSQNGYPFDDFHVLIGLLPSMVHPDPDHGLAIGLGIGSTSFGMLASGALEQVTTVELCGGNYELIEALADRGIAEFDRLATDPRHREVVDDGRRHLLVEDGRYDLIVPDTLRPNAPGANNLYSAEFQALVADRLAPGGITAGWVPSYRALNAVTTTFPYVVGLAVDSYASEFYLASDRPISLDPGALADRVATLPDDVIAPAQRASLARLLRDATPTCYAAGEVAQIADGDDVNRDLQPRDEYVLARPAIDVSRIARTCT